jgi:hypothetical protein
MYAGHIVELPVGTDGLTGSKNLGTIRPSQLLQATNVTYEQGTIQKEPGATAYNGTAITGSPSIIGGWDWWPTNGVQRMVVMGSDGKLYKDDGAGTFGTTLKSGLTVTNVAPVFVEGGKEAAAGNRKLFTFTGVNAVQVLSADGATTTDLATPPADWSGTNQPVAGLIHEYRLMGFGNLNDPHRLYWSTPTNHEDFTGTDSGTLAIYPGEGERLICGMSFKWGVVLWKYPKGIYIVDTSDPNIDNWRVFKINDKIGMASPLAAGIVDDDILFMDSTSNLQFISAVQAYGDMANRNLSAVSDIATLVRDSINFGQLGNVRFVYYGAKREAHFAVAGTGSNANNARLVVDFNRPDLPRFRWSDRDRPQSIWLRKDSNNVPRLVHGDDTGKVWLMDQSNRTKGGAYNGQFQTAHTDLGFLDPALATKRKMYDYLELVVEPKGNWNVSADIVIDGDIKETVQFNMGQNGAGLGSFTLGTDALAGEAVLNKKKRIHGSGRRFSVIYRNNGDGEDFSIAKSLLHARVSDERL